MPQQRLRQMLDETILRGRLEDDFVPAFFPGCRQATIPTMFGAREIVIEADYTCTKIIREIEQVRDTVNQQRGRADMHGAHSLRPKSGTRGWPSGRQ